MKKITYRTKGSVMDIFFVEKRVFLAMLLLCLLSFSGSAWSQEAAEAGGGGGEAGGENAEAPIDPNVWKKQREEIFREIAKEADKRARATVTKEGIVVKINVFAKKYEDEVRKEENRYRRKFIMSEQNKWREMEDMPDEYPNMSKYMDISIPEWKVNNPVKKDILKIRDDLERELTNIFESACKIKDYEELEREGKKKYPMYKLEEGKKKPFVTNITLRGGRGYAAREIEGRLEAITVNRLRIGHRMISRNDLDEETQALFYDEVNQKMVEKYILQEQRRYKAIKEGFVNEWVSMAYPDMLMSEGYVPKQYIINKTQRNSTNPQTWIQRNVYLDALYRTLLKKEIERITPEITKDFFENAVEKFQEKIGCEYNFEFVKEAGDPPGTGEWMPTNAADEFRMKKEQEGAENKPEGGEQPAP